MTTPRGLPTLYTAHAAPFCDCRGALCGPHLAPRGLPTEPSSFGIFPHFMDGVQSEDARAEERSILLVNEINHTAGSP
jgi:hypothetical protein